MTSTPDYPAAEAHIAEALRLREQAEALDPAHRDPAWSDDLAANKGEEAEILIAVLTFAEGAALVENPAIVEALKVLQPWRTALLRAYLRQVGIGNSALSEASGHAAVRSDVP